MDFCTAPFSISIEDVGATSIWDYLDVEPDEGDRHTWRDLSTYRKVEELLEEIICAKVQASSQSIEVDLRDAEGHQVFLGVPEDCPEWPWFKPRDGRLRLAMSGAMIHPRFQCFHCWKDRDLVVITGGTALCMECLLALDSGTLPVRDRAAIHDLAVLTLRAATGR